jgi:hypothetical protein
MLPATLSKAVNRKSSASVTYGPLRVSRVRKTQIGDWLQLGINTKFFALIMGLTTRLGSLVVLLPIEKTFFQQGKR